MAALSLSPNRQRLGLLPCALQDGYYQTPHIVVFPRDLLWHFRGKVVIVWDGWKTHGAALREVQSSRLEAVTLPPDAPELNPVKQLWSRLKWAEFANAAFADSTELLSRLKPRLGKTSQSRSRLLSFCQGAKLRLLQIKFQI